MRTIDPENLGPSALAFTSDPPRQFFVIQPAAESCWELEYEDESADEQTSAPVIAAALQSLVSMQRGIWFRYDRYEV